MITGMQEIETGRVQDRIIHDEEAVEKVLTHLDLPELRVIKVTRIGKHEAGKSRMMRVTMRDEFSRMQVLRNAKSLRSFPAYSKVFINPDRTPKEQMQFKASYREFKERKQNGEDVIFYRGKSVERSKLKGNFQYGF